MTTERAQPASPAAGFDTLEEANRIKEAGVPEEHAVAILYAAIAAADARFAQMSEEFAREIAAVREQLAHEIADTRGYLMNRLGWGLLGAVGVVLGGVALIVHLPPA